MNVSKRILLASGFVHGLAYVLFIINLVLMNFNVLIGKPAYVFVNIPLSIIAMLLCGVVLAMRKGTDNTPLFGVLLNASSVVVVMGTVFFFDG